MAGQIDQLKSAGFSDDEISSYATSQQQKLAAAGFNQQEINGYLGAKAPPAFDHAPVVQHFKNALDTHIAPAAEGGEPKSVTSFEDALSAGMQMSVSGLVARGKAPDKMLSEDAPWYARAGYAAAEMTGDIPAMAGGAYLSKSAGGAFALPTAMRGLLMDSYTKGQFKSFGDFWERVSPILQDTAKAYVTGEVTGFAGKRVGAALPETLSPSLKVAAKFGAEATTMTTVGAALDGRIPKAQDFVDNAILIGGFHAVGGVSAKLRAVYAKTGIPPDAVHADATQDPTIGQDLMSDNHEIPEAYRQGGLANENVAPDATPKTAAAPAPAAPEPGTTEEAQAKVLSKVSIGDAPGKKSVTLDQVYTNLFDELHPLKAPSEGLPTSENPYELARLTRGVAGKSQHMLDYGTFDFNTYENTGASLKAVLEPVRDDLDGFRAYAVARRSVELEGRGIKSGVDADAAAKVVQDGGKYATHFKNLVDYQNRVAAYARDAGVLSKDGYKAMLDANKNFVPFYRVMEDTAGSSGATRGGSPFKKIKGSDRTIIDPIESAVKNTYAITGLAERNAVNASFAALGPDMAEKVKAPTKPVTVQDKEMTDFLQSHGITEVPDELLTVFRAGKVPLEADQIRVFEDGKPVTYKVDPDIAAALGNGLQPADVNLFMKMLRLPANLMRAGAVLTPEFGIRHMMRDALYTFVTSDPGKTVTPWDMAKGLSGLLLQDPAYKEWLKSGGSNISMVALDRRYVQNSLEDLTAKTGLMSRGWNVVKNPLDTMRAFTELAENASHLGAFKKYAAGADGKSALQDAGFASRNVGVDTARIGAKMRAYNMITAFANVTLQDTDTVVRAIGRNPVSTGVKIGMGVVLPSALLWYANRDDQRVQELPDWEKDLFWIVPTDKWEKVEDPRDAAGVPDYLLRAGKDGATEMNNGHIFRIPKPFGMGIVFGSGTERTLDAYVKHDPDAFKGFIRSIEDTVLPDFYPTAATPMIEQFANRSTFSGSAIVPSYAEKLLPEYQYTPYTTEAAKKIGQVIGAFPGMEREAVEDKDPIVGGVARALTSPALIENYIRAWGGGLGHYLLQIGDGIARKTGALEDPVKAEGTLADIPVIKAFIARYPTAGAESVQEFYDNYATQKQVYDTIMSRAEQGDPDGMRRAQAVDPSAIGKLDSIQQTLQEHSKLIRDINDLQGDQTASDKRQTIDRLYYNMISIAREGNRANREISKSLHSVAK